MPEVVDKTTEEVVAKFSYDLDGETKAQQLADTDLNFEVREAPQNALNEGAYQGPSENEGMASVNAMERNKTMYPGGGKTGYNIPMYKKGGKVK